MNADAQRVSRLPLLIMGAVIAMIALLTVALLATRSPATYPDGSPEAALQDFVTATLDDDDVTMLALLTDDARRSCGDEIDRIDNWTRDDMRAELESIDVEASTAEASVRFRRVDSGDVFGGSSWDVEATFELIRVDGVWLVDRAGWPYALQRCSDGDN